MYLSASILLLAVVFSIVLPVVANAASYVSYPAMPSGKSTGSITGRVTNTNGTGIADANVTIINASNLSIMYTFTKTDNSGYYGFSAVNSTDGQGAYRAYANASGYSDAYSVPLVVEPANTCNVITLIMGGNGPSATPAATPRPGSVAGYVKLAGNSDAVSRAKVTLVNALDAFTTYDTVYTDNNGRYEFASTKVIASPGYRVHVEKDGYVEQFSSSFLVYTATPITINLTISKASDKSSASNSGNTTSTVNTSAQAGTVSSQTQPSASTTPQAGAGLLGMPGFGAGILLVGIVIAFAVARKK